jgi:phage shock protein PspC (stress-responsive transcriptional regulator)
MSETPPQAPPPTGHEPGHGWNTEHLKDYRRMRRSTTDRKVAGVAGGLGRHIDVDPTVLRVLFVVLSFFGGAGILLYGAMWLVVPEEGTEKAVVGTSDATRNTVLIAVAAVAALLAIGDSWNGVGFPWGLVVAGVVLFLVLANRDSNAPRPTEGRFPPPGAEPTAAYPLGYNPAVPPGYVPEADGGYGYPADATWAPPVPPVPAAPPCKTGPLLFGPTLALVTLALGALGLYDANGGSVVDAAYPALAVAVIGGALVVGAFYGRAGGLPLLGIVAALALPLAAVGGPSFEGDRDVLRRPVTAAALEDSISVPAGRIVVDLTAIRDLSELDGRELEVDVNAGEIVVVVPEGLRVDYDAAIEFGGFVDPPGTDDDVDGWGPSAAGVLNRTAPTRISVDADLRFGHIELRQS